MKNRTKRRIICGRRILAIVLALLLAGSGLEAVPQIKAAESDTLRNQRVYVKSEERIIDSGSCGEDAVYTAIEYENDKYELVISGMGETADYQGVNGVPKRTPWADYCKNIKKIVIENGITKIGNDNFHGCKIKSITFPDTLKEIGERAFGYAGNIENLLIPEGVEIIQDEGFYLMKSIKSVVLPSTLKYLGEEAFDGCSTLESVTFLGDTEINSRSFAGCSKLREINMIGNVTRNEHAKKEFWGCSSLENICLSDTYHWENSGWLRDSFSSLKNIDVKESNQYYTVVDGILYTKDKKELVYCPPGKQIKEYEIPDSTEVIRAEAFYDNENLEYIYMPDSVKEIGAAAFKGAAALKYAVISDSVSSISAAVFPNTEGLSIYVPESVTKTRFIEGWTPNDSFGCVEGERKIHIYGEEDSYIAKTYADVFKKAIYADFIVDGELIKRKVLFPDYKYGTLPQIVKNDKKFLGWYTEENGGREISSTDLFVGDSSIKLYAHWDNKDPEQPSTPSNPSGSENTGNNPTGSGSSGTSSGNGQGQTNTENKGTQDGTQYQIDKGEKENSGMAVKLGQVRSLKAKNKKRKTVTLLWRKAAGAKKYQIQYSQSKKFKKVKTKTTKKTSLKIKKLKKKKTYYFRVCAVAANAKKGKWSKKVKVRIKK